MAEAFKKIFNNQLARQGKLSGEHTGLGLRNQHDAPQHLGPDAPTTAQPNGPSGPRGRRLGGVRTPLSR